MRILKARLVMVSLALMVGISLGVHSLLKRSVGSPLHCHLIAKQKLAKGDDDFLGVFELRNDVKEPIAIKYLESMTEHLSIDISDPAGKPVPKGIPYYGDLYWPGGLSEDRRDKTLVLKPGETYRVNLDLFGQVASTSYRTVPGEYTFEAVFKWAGKEFRSNRVTVAAQAVKNRSRRNPVSAVTPPFGYEIRCQPTFRPSGGTQTHENGASDR